MRACLLYTREKHRQHNLLHYGLSVGDVSKHHALDDAVVFLFRQVLVGDQGSIVLGGWGRVYPLQPGMALNLLQGGPSLRIPLKHTVYQTKAMMRRQYKE